MDTLALWKAAAILLAGLMVGNELAVTAFIHPQLRRLPDAAHAAAARALARLYGAVMPGWYAAVLAASTWLAFLLWREGEAWLGAAVASLLWLASILFTVFGGPVRINSAVGKWDLEALPADWKEQRLRWDSLHALRVLLLLAALTCLVWGAVSAR